MSARSWEGKANPPGFDYQIWITMRDCDRKRKTSTWKCRSAKLWEEGDTILPKHNSQPENPERHENQWNLSTKSAHPKAPSIGIPPQPHQTVAMGIRGKEKRK
jgi:hypothetical protein